MASPLFIPLGSSFFDMFRDGSKVTELRRYGPRWNETTCWVGRDVVLSRGYGKTHRLVGVIARVDVVDIEQLTASDRFQLRQCYDTIHRVIAITIGNLEDPHRSCRVAMRQSVEPVRRYLIQKFDLSEDTQIADIEFDSVGELAAEMRVKVQRAELFERGPLAGEPDWSRAIGSPRTYALTAEDRRAIRDNQ